MGGVNIEEPGVGGPVEVIRGCDKVVGSDEILGRLISGGPTSAVGAQKIHLLAVVAIVVATATVAAVVFIAHDLVHEPARDTPVCALVGGFNASAHDYADVGSERAPDVEIERVELQTCCEEGQHEKDGDEMESGKTRG